MAYQYIRASDGTAASETEALDAARRLRPGYKFAPWKEGDYISFDLAFMDSTAAPAPSSPLSAGDQAAIVARAEMLHRTSTAYLGDRAPAFTDAMAQLAVRKVEQDLARINTNTATFAADAVRLSVENDVARAQMIDALRNGWRN